MRDQRFSKHTLIEIWKRKKGKTSFNKNFASNSHTTLPSKQDVLKNTCLWSRGIWKCPLKRLLLEYKKGSFSWNQAKFWPLIAILASRVQSQKNKQTNKKHQPFFAFLWSRMCTTLVFKWNLGSSVRVKCIVVFVLYIDNCLCMAIF